MNCVHQATKREWNNLQNGVMKLHPYCNKCGTVKNVSSDRGKKMGYFVTALSRIRKMLAAKGYKVSDAQIRLILKELGEVDGFEDAWWITFSRQREIFIRIVHKYIRVSRDFLEAELSLPTRLSIGER
jgi:hypothetical protein